MTTTQTKTKVCIRALSAVYLVIFLTLAMMSTGCQKATCAGCDFKKALGSSSGVGSFAFATPYPKNVVAGKSVSQTLVLLADQNF
jgi:hypothetical protein